MAMLTVQAYANSRKLSVATVKNHIKKLELDLPLNPQDNRQRLISLDNQRKLDESTRRSAPPTPTVPTVEAEIIEVTPYVRSESASMVIAEGEILKAQYLIPHQPTEQNPLLLALQQQAAEMQQANLARYAQLQQNAQTQNETQQAIAAAKRIRLMEQAQQQAFENHQLKKQLIAQAETELELMDMGLGLPTPKPQPSPPQPASVAPSPELQPDWL
jgi:hypothetical protein